MKKKQLNLNKLSLKKSTVAGFKANKLIGGTGTSWDGCPTIPGEPCDFPTDFGCGNQTVGCPTQGCPPPTQGCVTQGCPPNTGLVCEPQSHSVCPPGIQCF
ncbi:hypothetical protein GWK08_10610 [Leptobacterium flavescens]|uniref:Uncharacterized protein n=1 Tax=Leptobacterium flavescens TaxID=472055 RepID=A0A6P0USQ3_9FLAO|nr:hypothetical protein [Leptobacterium flavescens]NER13893.1 hypothetical protein [Leptobacterium flavescens]